MSQLSAPRGRFARIRELNLPGARWLFVSGTAASLQTPPTITEQSEQVFDRIRNLLEENGAGMNDIVRIQVYLANMADYAAYNVVRNSVFERCNNLPASTAVEARLVDPRFLIEIDATAVVPIK